MPRIKAVYVEQFGYFWKFTTQEWIKICKEGIETGGHFLPDVNRLKHRPGCIGASRLSGDDSIEYFAKTNDVLFFSPLDWELTDYQDALEEINNIIKNNKNENIRTGID